MHNYNIVFSCNYTRQFLKKFLLLFMKGSISNRKEKRMKGRKKMCFRIGESRTMRNGHRATIIEYNNSKDITIEFDTGEIRYHMGYGAFVEGKISIKARHDLIKKTIFSSCGLKYKILNKYHSDFYAQPRCDIIFEDGYVRKNVDLACAATGNISHDFLSSRYGSDDFHGFTSKFVSRADKVVYYKCECNKCKVKDIMTPQQMIQHKCKK